MQNFGGAHHGRCASGVVLFFIGPDFVSVNTMLGLLQVDLS